MSSLGGQLALFTWTVTDKHPVYLYDIKRNNFNAAATFMLEDFSGPRGTPSEVNCAKFSSDGTFLAVALNDNSFHVYDTRMWKAPIHRLGHDNSPEFDANKSIGEPNFGVTHLEWVNEPWGGGLGLLSGGGDGMVPLPSFQT